MDIQEYKNVWVFIETENGKTENVSLELLSEGKTLANSKNEKLIAIVIGHDVQAAVKSTSTYGADEVIQVEKEEYKDYSTDAYTNVMETLVAKYKPSIILFGATNDGKDLAARLAARVHTSVVSDCTELKVSDHSGEVEWTRPVYGGNLLATVSSPNQRPQIATFRTGIFKKDQPDDAKSVNVVQENIKTPSEAIRTKIIDIIKSSEESGVKLEEAKVVVSGGRGLGKPENFTLVKELADLFGGAVGATRAVIDAGWISPPHQVGQSGKTVSPDLYIACGISGAIQHVSGMKSSKVIIAINKDPDAPIFDIADYAVVGDVLEIVPVLIEEIKKLKDA